MCALRWYIKSLFRHLFLVDISKHARVTPKKWHFLICGKDNSKAPWATRPQIGLRVAKALSCDTDERNFFPVNPPPPPPRSYGAKTKRDHRNLPYAYAISVIPPLLSTITQGGFTGKKFRLVSITAKCFSYPQTNLGARRSRRLWVIFATN